MNHLKSAVLVAVFLTFNAKSQPLDSARTLAFLDGVMNSKLHDKNIAGATLAVTQNGKIILLRGYGFADIENQTPVDPTKTLFRIGSISKLFVWTSVMQLASQGKLNLNANINQYLKDVEIPNKDDQSITLKHLLTHTPGFEDQVLQLFGRDSTSLRPLREILKEQMPDRVRPPGTQASYSNHGTAMAAYIVEKISGMSFNDYVNQNIIKPMGMSHTTFVQPLPDSLKSAMSIGYQFSNNEFTEKEFEFVPLYPVGAATSSATDMAKLMNAYLNHGAYNDFQLLDSATLSLMMSPAHQHHPDVNPMRYGFMDISQNGETVIGHGGDTFWFHSGFFFLPAHNVGVFLSFNTNTGGGVYMDVIETFLDEFFPDQRPVPSALNPSSQWLSGFSGEYVVNRYSHDDIFKVASLGGRLNVSTLNGKLKITTDNEIRFYVPSDTIKNTFREEFKSDKIAFEKNAEGLVTHAYFGVLPIFAYDKVSGLDAAKMHKAIFAIAIATTLVCLLYWPFVAWIRRGYRPASVISKTIPGMVKTFAWLNYFFLFLFLVLLLVGMGDPMNLVFDIPLSVRAALVFPLLMFPTTVLMIIFLFRLFLDTDYKFISRIYYLLLCAVSVVTLWQLYYWNFIGFNY